MASFSERLLFFSLRCIVFLLNAAVFADLALYLAVGGLSLGLVELSCPLTQSRASRTSGTVSSAAYPCCVELLTLPYHILSQARRLEICNIAHDNSAAVCPRSASLHLATALLSALGRAPKIGTLLRVIFWVICASHDTCGVAAVFCTNLISS